MNLDLYDALDLAALTGGYWIFDGLIRRDGFLRVLERVGVASWKLGGALWVVPCILLSPFWGWGAVPQGNVVRFLSLSLALMLTWKAVTKDIDVVVGESRMVTRVLLLASTVGIYMSPAFLLVSGFLLTTPFAVWEHHSTLPMRVVLGLMAYACLATVLRQTPMFSDASAIVFFVVVMQVSHYLITALAKMLLGPKWYSWVTDNRLHHMAASAYSWGWARFFPWTTWRKVIGALRVTEKPIQLVTFSVELLAPLALLHPHAAIAFSLAWSAFHLGVVAVSGLFFWDWILTNLAIAYAITLLPAAVVAQVFGPVSCLVALVFLAAFPMRHKLWKPMPLGWFDTPFTQRIHWRVHGDSGTVYGLYNDFMCPHERVYGKVHGCFLAPVPVVTYHLGEVWKPELRDALRSAGPDQKALDEVRRRFGITPRSEEMAANHAGYLQRFFYELNRGARKHVLPRPLRWLKAPGDQLFYWGELPPYTGQEKATRVTLHYREEYFDGDALKRLRDELVLQVDVPSEPASEIVREYTPKEIDDFLLRFAAGRLVDLPGFKRNYLERDDGKASPAPRRASAAEPP